jgi:hypothetical protein
MGRAPAAPAPATPPAPHALEINERGAIIGQGALANGDQHVFLLVPCPDDHSDEEGCEDAAGSATAPAKNSPALVGQNPIDVAEASQTSKGIAAGFMPNRGGIAASDLGCEDRFVEHLSEPLTKMMPADQSAPERQERLMYVGSSFIPNPQPPELKQPGEGPFHYPSLTAKPAVEDNHARLQPIFPLGWNLCSAARSSRLQRSERP